MAIPKRTRLKPAPAQNFNRPWWSIETIHPNSHLIRLDDVGAGYERWIMLRSDAHHDNIHSLHDLEREHLEMARDRDAMILDAGDIYCAMQGRGDPRGSYDALRPEHRTDKYLDALVSTAIDFYAPYARNFALIGHGNHETKVIKHYGTDLVDRLAAGLRGHGGATLAGAYSGWVTLRFQIHQTINLRKVIRYYHGSGGGGPVTRGTIQTNRHAVNWPDANIVFSGHTHDSWMVPIARERINLNGEPYNDIAYHLRTPTYKDETSGGMGWAVERGLNPKPLGCWWLRLTYRHRGQIEIMPMPEHSAGPGLPQHAVPIDPNSPGGVPYFEMPAGYDSEGGEGDG